ncbi:GntR family transcriptional regulator [Rossellomorea aquimaris]|nr:GntR family transcriptional regulator [Rossellomorea aquimaris]WRP08773.1 GntR family transcriptional regulator [Rossellomorea aquimaris]
MPLKERSSDNIRSQLIQSILEGHIKFHQPLQSERELATRYQVGRPTIREALQRLERDGWITGRKGMPAVVNDYWKQGNLMTIVNILAHQEEVPDEFIHHMLELRISLTPTYFRDALHHNKLKVISLFVPLEEVQDDARSYADFDWQLQQSVAMLSANPIYVLILNSFKDFYRRMAEKYFSEPDHRKASRDYYEKLLDFILNGDIEQAERLIKEMMETSLRLWKQKMNGGS